MVNLVIHQENAAVVLGLNLKDIGLINDGVLIVNLVHTSHLFRWEIIHNLEALLPVVKKSSKKAHITGVCSPQDLP